MILYYGENNYDEFLKGLLEIENERLGVKLRLEQLKGLVGFATNFMGNKTETGKVVEKLYNDLKKYNYKLRKVFLRWRNPESDEQETADKIYAHIDFYILKDEKKENENAELIKKRIWRFEDRDFWRSIGLK